MNKLFNLDESFSKKKVYGYTVYKYSRQLSRLKTCHLRHCKDFFAVGNTPVTAVLQGHFGLWMLCLKASCVDVRCVIHPLEVGQPT